MPSGACRLPEEEDDGKERVETSERKRHSAKDALLLLNVEVHHTVRSRGWGVAVFKGHQHQLVKAANANALIFKSKCTITHPIRID